MGDSLASMNEKEGKQDFKWSNSRFYKNLPSGPRLRGPKCKTENEAEFYSKSHSILNKSN